MTEDRYIAAIEISSSKIMGALGKTSGAGQLDVVDIEVERCVDEVRWGIIQNLEDTSLRIDRIISKLERNSGIAPRKITGVFVGLSGRSMRSVPTEVSLQLPADSEITDGELAKLKEQAKMTQIDSSLKIIDAIPRTYFVDKQEITSPKGTVGHSIRAVFDLIVCRPELFKNMNRTIEDKCGIRINGEIVTSLACGHLILTSDEKRLGCMLVDMGAETTAVSIYTNGKLKYYATIPLGGRNITRDLTTLSLLEERAEDIKRDLGNAISGPRVSSININGLRHSDVSNLIVARSEEIVANVVEQLNYAGVTEKDLRGGIIVVGGASALNGMTELLEKKSGMSVRRGRLPQYIDFGTTRLTEQEAAGVVSILYAGATKSGAACLEELEVREMPSNGVPNDPVAPDEPADEPEVVPKAKKKRWIKLKKTISDLFTPSSDDENEDSELL